MSDLQFPRLQSRYEEAVVLVGSSVGSQVRRRVRRGSPSRGPVCESRVLPHDRRKPFAFLAARTRGRDSEIDGRAGLEGRGGGGDDRASRAAQGGRCRRGHRYDIRARVDAHTGYAEGRRRAATQGAPVEGVAPIDDVTGRARVLPADGAERRQPRAGQARRDRRSEDGRREGPEPGQAHGPARGEHDDVTARDLRARARAGDRGEETNRAGRTAPDQDRGREGHPP